MLRTCWLLAVIACAPPVAQRQASATAVSPAPRDALPDGEAVEVISAAPTFSENVTAALGTPCENATAAGQQCWLCDPHGRIVGAVVPGDFVHIDRASTSVVASSRDGTSPRRLEFVISVDGGGLRAQVLTCPGCRRQIGWALEVTSAGWTSLDASLRSELQASLGYAVSPMSFAELRTPPANPPAPRPIACPAGSRS